MTDYLDKDDIRQVACPVCEVGVGEDCLHFGKGAAKKTRNRQNHMERMTLAQAAFNAGDLSLADIEVIDFDDDPRTWAVLHPPSPRMVHFVGFRGDEFLRAQRVFGPPDFIHLIHDHRMYGDVGEDDILVFGPKADPDKISAYSWQDHELN